MKIFAETKRMILREILPADKFDILRLDSDPEVVRYLPVKAARTLEEAEDVVNYIQKQYIDNKIGRWVMQLKESGEFVGWCGIKLVNDAEYNGRTNFYDLGYRLLQNQWGKGLATEAALVCVDYAFMEMKLTELNGMVLFNNFASARVLEKVGMTKETDFVDENGNMWDWFSMTNKRTERDPSI